MLHSRVITKKNLYMLGREKVQLNGYARVDVTSRGRNLYGAFLVHRSLSSKETRKDVGLSTLDGGLEL